MSRLASRTEAQRPARTVSPETRMESHQKVHVWPGPAEWTERSACVGEDPDLFDATTPAHLGINPHDLAAPALAICARCPVTRECRELGDSLPIGTRDNLIFGGHLYGSRRASPGSRARGGRAPNITPGDPCAGSCGRPLRPHGTSLTDYPETVVHSAQRMCSSCYGKRNETTDD